MAVGAKPGDRVSKTLDIGPRNIAELAPRPGIVEEHMVTRHPQAVRRDKRLNAAQSCQELRSVSDGIKHCPRQLDCRRSSSDQPCDVGKHIAEEDVVAAKNVTLSDSPAFKRGDVSGRYVIDMREVQTGVDKSRHAPRCSLNDDTPGRR